MDPNVREFLNASSTEGWYIRCQEKEGEIHLSASKPGGIGRAWIAIKHFFGDKEYHLSTILEKISRHPGNIVNLERWKQKLHNIVFTRYAQGKNAEEITKLWETNMGKLPVSPSEPRHPEKPGVKAEEDPCTYALQLWSTGKNEEAIKRLTELADGKDRKAMSILGHILFLSSKDEDRQKAVELIKKAAGMGYVDAIAFLFNPDQNVQGWVKEFKKEKDEGIKILRELADHKNLEAMFTLGTIYFSNLSGHEDRKKAFELINEAARRGSDDAIAFINDHKDAVCMDPKTGKMFTLGLDEPVT